MIKYDQMNGGRCGLLESITKLLHYRQISSWLLLEAWLLGVWLLRVEPRQVWLRFFPECRLLQVGLFSPVGQRCWLLTWLPISFWKNLNHIILVRTFQWDNHRLEAERIAPNITRSSWYRRVWVFLLGGARLLWAFPVAVFPPGSWYLGYRLWMVVERSAGLVTWLRSSFSKSCNICHVRITILTHTRLQFTQLVESGIEWNETKLMQVKWIDSKALPSFLRFRFVSNWNFGIFGVDFCRLCGYWFNFGFHLNFGFLGAGFDWLHGGRHFWCWRGRFSLLRLSILRLWGRNFGFLPILDLDLWETGACWLRRTGPCHVLTLHFGFVAVVRIIRLFSSGSFFSGWSFGG